MVIKTISKRCLSWRLKKRREKMAGEQFKIMQWILLSGVGKNNHPASLTLVNAEWTGFSWYWSIQFFHSHYSKDSSRYANGQTVLRNNMWYPPRDSTRHSSSRPKLVIATANQKDRKKARPKIRRPYMLLVRRGDWNFLLSNPENAGQPVARAMLNHHIEDRIEFWA